MPIAAGFNPASSIAMIGMGKMAIPLAGITIPSGIAAMKIICHQGKITG
jgi:hypothetical protein